MKFQPLTDRKVSPLKSKRNVYLADIPAGTDREDVLKPEYWANIAEKIRLRDHIEADWEDGTRIITLRVVGVGMDYVKTVLLSEHKLALEESEQEFMDQFEIVHRGEVHKWAIVRKSTGRYAKYGFDSDKDANDWLKANVNAIAA